MKGHLHANIDMSYESTAERHYVNCGEWLEKAKSLRDYVYAALEIRMCIERLCFEYLKLLTHDKRPLTKTEKNTYQPKAFFDRVLKESPHFEKMIDFANVVFESHGRSERLQFPDISELVKMHGKLGGYLHLQTDPMSVAKKEYLIKLVGDVFARMKEYVTYPGKITNLADHAQSIFDRFVRGDIDRDQMKRMVHIATIPDHMYNPRK